MPSPDERWWTVRAGEYVLGTLRGRDLEMFEKILAHDTEMQQEVARWERQLAALDGDLAPVQPGDHLLPQILERIRQAQDDGSSPFATLASEPVASASPAAKPSRSRFWPAVAGLATAASLVLAVLLLQRDPAGGIPGFEADGIAVVAADDTGELYYLVETDYGKQQVRVTALSPPSVETAQNLQLWQATPDRSAVRPVTLLPESAGVSTIYDVSALIEGSDLFGVSIEAVGAPTDNGPQGPVVAHGDYLKTRLTDRPTD